VTFVTSRSDPAVDPAIDPGLFRVHVSEGRGFRQAYVHEKPTHGGRSPALVCVHGWPESKRIFWKVVLINA